MNDPHPFEKMGEQRFLAIKWADLRLVANAQISVERNCRVVCALYRFCSYCPHYRLIRSASLKWLWWGFREHASRKFDRGENADYPHHSRKFLRILLTPAQLARTFRRISGFGMCDFEKHI